MNVVPCQDIISFGVGTWYSPSTGRVFSERSSSRKTPVTIGKFKELKPPKSSALYHNINIDGEHHTVHRAAWRCMRGKIPAGMVVDHINGVRNDNRIANLQILTPSQNLSKCSPKKGRLLGIGYLKARRKWVIRISVNDRSQTVGYAKTRESAYLGYLSAKANLHGVGSLRLLPGGDAVAKFFTRLQSMSAAI